MKVQLWGTRGSLATPGPETARYGGNTSCVEVRGADDTLLVLDAGTGIRRLGTTIPFGVPRRIDLLLTHLHLDHIQGLGFFGPLYDPAVEVHIWGPASTTQDLHTRLSRYLSPPLFPVLLRDLNCKLTLHEVPTEPVKIGCFTVYSETVCHPGPTVGFRIEDDHSSMAYIPDHEPAIGGSFNAYDLEWVSGSVLAKNVDLLIHDTQYTDAEYPAHTGWGHSSLQHSVDFALKVGSKILVPFHHDPSHTDDQLDQMILHAATLPTTVRIEAGKEGREFIL